MTLNWEIFGGQTEQLEAGRRGKEGLGMSRRAKGRERQMCLIHSSQRFSVQTNIYIYIHVCNHSDI